MDIEILIGYVKKRPCMFIRELNFDYLHHFLGGFLCYSGHNEKADKIDNIFKWEFHDWTRKWIEKNKNISFDETRGYDYYIKSVCETQEECFDLFFYLCDIFFKEVHNNTLIYKKEW